MNEIGTFDILGPNMIGPSSSHTAGALRIAFIAGRMVEKPVSVKFELYGSFARTYHGHGTDRALVAGLLGMLPDDERVPFSFEEAKKMEFINIGPRMDNSSNISGTYRYAIDGYNCILQKKAISKLKVGDTIEKLEEYLEEVKLEKHNKPEGLDRFITKINKPIFPFISSPF